MTASTRALLLHDYRAALTEWRRCHEAEMAIATEYWGVPYGSERWREIERRARAASVDEQMAWVVMVTCRRALARMVGVRRDVIETEAKR